MAISGHIKIEKELALQWHRRALRVSFLFHIAYYFAVRLTIFWLVIAMTDAIGGHRDLAPLHALTFFLIWIGITGYHYYFWYRNLENTVVGWEFDATLDEEGVKTDTKVETKVDVPWTFYKGYREYDDHLEIHDKERRITFVPKTDELADLVTFTKDKIQPL